MQTISIIRNRNQLTLPYSIRKLTDWVEVDTAVAIRVTPDNEIVIKPHSPRVTKSIVWAKIHAARQIQNKKSVASAVEFIVADRQDH